MTKHKEMSWQNGYSVELVTVWLPSGMVSDPVVGRACFITKEVLCSKLKVLHL